MTIFIPFIYLLAGWLIGKTTWDFKTAASWVLTHVAIPVVIIFNISMRFGSMSPIMIATAIIMLVMLITYRSIFNDPIKALCFSYLNIGWLGLPVATALFGNEAATIVIAAYVGSSIVGNSIGAAMLSGQRFNLFKLIQTPPVLALIIGAALIPFSQHLSVWVDGLYEIAKFLMSFLGMAVLGIWLSKTDLTVKDLQQEIRPYMLKTGVIFILMLVVIELANMLDFRLVTENTATLYLLCLLPPAANIIVLETHYLGTGYSAKRITCGTCLSIIAMSIFAAAVAIFRTRGLLF